MTYEATSASGTLSGTSSLQLLERGSCKGRHVPSNDVGNGKRPPVTKSTTDILLLLVPRQMATKNKLQVSHTRTSQLSIGNNKCYCSTPSNLEITQYGADAYHLYPNPIASKSMYGSKTSQL